MRFRNDNIVVIGAGEQKTPQSFRNACDRFIDVGALLKADEPEIEQENDNQNANDEKLQHLINTAKEIINEKADTDGWMDFATFMGEIYRKENDFNTKPYGYRNASSMFKNIENDGKKIFTLTLNGGSDKIKLLN